LRAPHSQPRGKLLKVHGLYENSRKPRPINSVPKAECVPVV
jgi:hypothetical protein